MFFSPRPQSDEFEDDQKRRSALARQNILAGRSGPDVIPAAAELSFLHAGRAASAYYLAAAVYAWIFLFPDDAASLPLDPSTRVFAWRPTSTTEGSRSGWPRRTGR